MRVAGKRFLTTFKATCHGVGGGSLSFRPSYYFLYIHRFRFGRCHLFQSALLQLITSLKPSVRQGGARLKDLFNIAILTAKIPGTGTGTGTGTGRAPSAGAGVGAASPVPVSGPHRRCRCRGGTGAGTGEGRGPGPGRDGGGTGV